MSHVSTNVCIAVAAQLRDHTVWGTLEAQKGGLHLDPKILSAKNLFLNLFMISIIKCLLFLLFTVNDILSIIHCSLFSVHWLSSLHYYYDSIYSNYSIDYFFIVHYCYFYCCLFQGSIGADAEQEDWCMREYSAIIVHIDLFVVANHISRVSNPLVLMVLILEVSWATHLTAVTNRLLQCFAE